MRLSYEPRQLRPYDAREFGTWRCCFAATRASARSRSSAARGTDAIKRRGVDAHAFHPRATALSDLIARRFDASGSPARPA